MLPDNIWSLNWSIHLISIYGSRRYAFEFSLSLWFSFAGLRCVVLWTHQSNTQSSYNLEL